MNLKSLQCPFCGSLHIRMIGNSKKVMKQVKKYGAINCGVFFTCRKCGLRRMWYTIVKVR